MTRAIPSFFSMHVDFFTSLVHLFVRLCFSPFPGDGYNIVDNGDGDGLTDIDIFTDGDDHEKFD